VPNKLISYSNKNIEVKNSHLLALPWRKSVESTIPSQMQPRLASSITWTSFPEELIGQIKDVFTGFFEDYDLDGREFRVEGAIYPNEILLRVGLGKSINIRQHNFEASLEYKAAKENVLAEIHTAIDFLGATWQDYLEEPKEIEELPDTWVENTFEKKKIYLRHTSVNTDLEQEADRILEAYEKKLVYESENATEMIEDAQFVNPFKETPDDLIFPEDTDPSLH
jgi:hypothetical protein